MCDVTKYKKIYKEIRRLEIDDTLELIMEAEDQEEADFFELIGNFLMQKKWADIARVNVDEIVAEKGYNVEIHYIGLATSDIAKERVRSRVQKGGHGIPDEDIERRYVESFDNLRKVITMCDLVVLYDNTENFRRFAFNKNGKLARLSPNVPEWYYKIFNN